MDFNSPIAQKIKFIVLRKFPLVKFPSDAIAPSLSNTIAQTDNFETSIKQVVPAREFCSSLEKKSEDEIRSIYEEEKKMKEQEQDELDKEIFFSEKNTLDSDYWAKIGSWTTNEATAISFNLDPRKVKNMMRETRINEPTKFVSEYMSLKEIFDRIFKNNHDYNKYPSCEFIRISKEKTIPFPEDLVEKVNFYNKTQDHATLLKEAESRNNELNDENQKLTQENTKLKTDKSNLQQKLNTAQSYFAALCNDKFASNGKVTIANVESALQRQGLSPSEGTIRTHYNAGSKCLQQKNTNT